jgi:uncharacterized membrane protein YeaQ/YmgE (transglycosylase-associated protein family)
VELIWLLIIGGVVGWIASKVMGTDGQMGVLANIIVGIVGSALGFWLAGVMGFLAYGMLARLLVAVIGAVVLIFVLRKLGLFK